MDVEDVETPPGDELAHLLRTAGPKDRRATEPL